MRVERTAGRRPPLRGDPVNPDRRRARGRVGAESIAHPDQVPEVCVRQDRGGEDRSDREDTGQPGRTSTASKRSRGRSRTRAPPVSVWMTLGRASRTTKSPVRLAASRSPCWTVSRPESLHDHVDAAVRALAPDRVGRRLGWHRRVGEVRDRQLADARHIPRRPWNGASGKVRNSAGTGRSQTISRHRRNAFRR